MCGKRRRRKKYFHKHRCFAAKHKTRIYVMLCDVRVYLEMRPDFNGDMRVRAPMQLFSLCTTVNLHNFYLSSKNPPFKHSVSILKRANLYKCHVLTI